MKKKENTFSKVMKIILTIIALLNLAALFLFHYELPGFLSAAGNEPSDEARETTAPAAGASASGYSFQFDTDPLVYDGQTGLDLLSGVTLVSSDGQTSDAEIYAQIMSGDSLSRKTIEYSADTENGQVTASRGLELSAYAGPSISLPEELPDLEESQIDSVLSLLSGLYADDGYGNDITDSVTASYTMGEDGMTLHYTFSVTNLFNDTATAAADLSLTASKPVIRLTDTAVTIPAGSSFEPLAYVDSAVDVDGSSLSHRIYIRGSVDTETPGIYTLTYTATSEDGTASDPRELTVTVQ